MYIHDFQDNYTSFLDYIMSGSIKMKGNWIKWCKIAFGGACGALKRKYKKKQDSRRLFSAQKWGTGDKGLITPPP